MANGIYMKKIGAIVLLKKQMILFTMTFTIKMKIPMNLLIYFFV